VKKGALEKLPATGVQEQESKSHDSGDICAINHLFLPISWRSSTLMMFSSSPPNSVTRKDVGERERSLLSQFIERVSITEITAALMFLFACRRSSIFSRRRIFLPERGARKNGFLFLPVAAATLTCACL
jgi:hypothetical protein